jgi:hypothetical protein
MDTTQIFEYNPEADIFTLFERCYQKAVKVINSPELFEIKGNPSIDELARIFINLELEKIERDSQSDSLIDYNDEIVSIECLDEEIEMLDIQVSGSNLFYANGILTKNSSGILMTADLLLAIIRTEELDEMNQIIIKQLKNRFGDPNYYKRFIVGLDKSRMKMYNVTNDGQLNQEQVPKTSPSQTKESKFQTPKTQEWSF